MRPVPSASTCRRSSSNRRVDALRQTISIIRDGQQVTYPFNLELAYGLYRSLFGPVGAEIGSVTHLIFEPDGAMMKLPPNVLVMDHGGVDAYRVRSARPGDDGFDFRGIQWLGRDRDISTAVSARAFRDVRQAPPSRARAAISRPRPEPAGRQCAAAGRDSFRGSAGSIAPGRRPRGTGRFPRRSWLPPAGSHPVAGLARPRF